MVFNLQLDNGDGSQSPIVSAGSRGDSQTTHAILLTDSIHELVTESEK